MDNGGSLMNGNNIYRGVSFPFRFGANGGVAQSQLTHQDFSRIKESIYQIIFTSLGERIYKSDFGTKLRDYLFEVNGDITVMAIIKHEVIKAIETFEDRVVIKDVIVYTPSGEESKLVIDVTVQIVKFMKDATIQLTYDLVA